MTSYNSQENHLIVTLPGRNLRDLAEYRKGILSLLARVEIGNCSPEIKSDLKLIYNLLSHLQTKEEVIENERQLQKELASESSQITVS